MLELHPIIEKIYALSETGIKLGLKNMSDALSILGLNPDRSKILHVAGTNGKGSVCAMLHRLIVDHEKDKKVGLYTSPHLLDYRERIRINDQLISEEELIDSASIIFNKCKSIPLTFFEFTTLLAFMHFENKKTDYLILETGLGGRLDASNIVSRPKICIITSISMDHAQYLGESIEKIALEKAGIFKKGSKVILQRNSVVDLLESIAKEKLTSSILKQERDYFYSINDKKNLDLTIKNSNKDLRYSNIKLSLPGSHQYKNASTAIMALYELGINFSEKTLSKSLSSVSWPGRLEKMESDKRILYLDVSHNEEGISNTLEFLKSEHSGQNIYTVCGFMKDKDYSSMIEKISLSSKHVFLIPTSIRGRELRQKDYIEVIKSKDFTNYSISKNYTDAVHSAMKMSEIGSVVLFTGSIFNYQYISRVLR